MSLLSLENITIEFPGVRALDRVGFAVEPGEIHALVGENGAGKSTLIKIVAGVWTWGMYSGRMLVDGNEVRFHGVRDSERAQIRVIHQELSLVNEMSAAENVFLGDEPLRGGIIDYTRMRTETAAVLRRLGSDVGPEQKVSELTIGRQQIVEIAKALSKRARIIVFDEPTAALPEKDVENLLGLIRSLSRQGLGIIYISHKLTEVCDCADRVTVLRNGRRISEYVKGDLRPDAMVKDMIGRSLATVFPEQKPPGERELLRLEHVSLPHALSRGRDILQDVSFTCAAGEVVGIAGLLGSGRTALLSLLFGTFRGTYRGRIVFDGAEYVPESPADALSRGIALVSEDRKRYGVIGTADVKENLCLSSLSQFRGLGMISDARAAAACRSWIERLGVKTPSLSFPVTNLSGGNQQKVIVGRLLMTSPRLLLLDDPTRGIDVGAKHELYKLIHQLARDGIGIVFVSSELPEVLGIAHRVVVLHEGRLRTSFAHGEKTEEEVLGLAAGI